MPSEVATQDEVFKFTTWLCLIIWLQHDVPWHKHCFQHLYMNVSTLHSYFVHRLMDIEQTELFFFLFASAFPGRVIEKEYESG